jgi:hypothetical protein
MNSGLGFMERYCRRPAGVWRDRLGSELTLPDLPDWIELLPQPAHQTAVSGEIV